MTRSGLHWTSRLVPVALVVVGLAACAPRIPGAAPDLLTFLRAGETTREEVVLKLGQPSASFEQERILTYRVGQDPKQGFFLIVPNRLDWWQNVRYSVVLVFDANGVLEKQRFVPVRGGP
jgi:hypothetical protein